MLDWSDGQYELTAAELEPIAQLLVQRAGVQAQERVLDLGCGTGNVALAAAQAGARVIGVDPALRLLAVARERLAAASLPGELVAGDASHVPVGDAEVDVVLSNFALIFDADANAAVAECRRVLRPGGRLAFTTWLAEGTLDATMTKIRAALPAPPGAAPPPRFPWGDLASVTPLVARHFAEVSCERTTAVFAAESAAAFLEAMFEQHPVGRVWTRVLGAAGTLDAVKREALADLERGNEATAGFQVTSPYAIVSAR